MTIKFEKIKPGMRLYDRHREKMGNTTMRTLGEWDVRVIEVNADKRKALVSWNENRPEWWWADRLKKLSDWSMHDRAVAIVEQSSMTRQVFRCRKLTKAELAQRDAATHPSRTEEPGR
jgi:hypothetical protein